MQYLNLYMQVDIIHPSWIFVGEISCFLHFNITIGTTKTNKIIRDYLPQYHLFRFND